MVPLSDINFRLNLSDHEFNSLELYDSIATQRQTNLLENIHTALSERLRSPQDNARCPQVCTKIIAFSSPKTQSDYYGTTEDPGELIQQTCTVKTWCDIPCQTRGKLGARL